MVMRVREAVIITIGVLFLIGAPVCSFAGDFATRQCLPDRPIPPETVGPISIPFEFPIWPTLLKTEFHVLPWISLGKASVCIPGTCKAIEFPAPCLSLKPIPIWIPWLRPLDVECKDSDCVALPRK
jgi:hypothetical protein